MYEVGKVYIWQNLKQYTQLNGEETTVTSDMLFLSGRRFGSDIDSTFIVWETDTMLACGATLTASPGQLRPKYPPTGENAINSLLHDPALC